MNIARVVLFGVAAAVVAVGQDDAAGWETKLKSAKIGLTEAMEKAAKEVEGGTVFHAELEGDKTVVYSVDIAKGEKSVNVIVNAEDGKIAEKQDEDEDHSAEVKACKTSLAEAIQAALKKSAGRPVEAEILLREGKATIEVKIVGDGKVVAVHVDGETGRVAAGRSPAQDSFTDTFTIEEGDLGPTGRNPWFILEPGYQLSFEGKDEGEDATNVITVLDETKTIGGVVTRVVEERESKGGKLVEISRNWFAISKRTNSVFYFGEDVDIYNKEGKVVAHDGAWIHGEKGARFGLMIPGLPLLGARYYQEVAPGVAMDRAEIVGLNEKLETPAGKFEKCLKCEETTPLEKGRSHKVYAPGIGLIQDPPLKLVKYGMIKK